MRLYLFLLLFLMIVSFKNARPCHLYTGRLRFLGVGVLGCQLSVCGFDSTSFLLEFTYLFIRMIQSDEPSWADCCSSVLAAEKLKLLCSRTGSSQKPVLFIDGLCLWPWITFRSLFLNFVNKKKHVLNDTFLKFFSDTADAGAVPALLFSHTPTLQWCF